MPGVKPRYAGVASACPAGPGGVWVTPLAGEIAKRTSAVRIERITQYTGRKRERARSIPGPASLPIGAAQTLRTFCACKIGRASCREGVEIWVGAGVVGRKRGWVTHGC